MASDRRGGVLLARRQARRAAKALRTLAGALRTLSSAGPIDGRRSVGDAWPCLARWEGDSDRELVWMV